MRGQAAGWRMGVLALVTVSVLAGCSSLAGVGGSSFGSNALKPTEVANLGSYDAPTALREAKAHFRNADYGYSATLYQRVVELDPKNQQGYVGLGASYDRLGRFDLSDRVYAALFQISGGTAQYYNNVGYSYMLRGNLTAALTNFRKARTLDPNNAIVANNIQLLSNAASSRA